MNLIKRTERNIEADIEAEVTLLHSSEGGRQGYASSGYRPNHLVKPDYLTTGQHLYLDTDKVLLGGTAQTHITFISPEAYPHTLWVGRVIRVQEGPRLVGHARVTKIFNKLLETSTPIAEK